MMKITKWGAVLTIISAILILGIVSVWTTLKGHQSRQVKASTVFINNLYEKNIINLNEPIKEETFKEVKDSKNESSKIKYTLVSGNLAIDLDKHFKVIRFLEENINNIGECNITEDEAIKIAESYLDKIDKRKYKFKAVKKNEEEEQSFYAISFYKYHDKHLYYDNEVVLRIDKNNSKLVGYTTFSEEGIDYIDEINVKFEDATEMVFGYMDQMQIKGGVIKKPELVYISLTEEVNQLCYRFDVEITEGNQNGVIFEVFLNANNGQVVRSSLPATIN